ncbi:MAG: polysaccharide pyruvyl transferase CsaB [Fimbriimonadales bacterium]|nr:MAG: polysaccharide pyruvyl transferase CsaB [Fimbriimonadales bacterium]
MRIVIAGYYGYHNWGDEGALATLLRGLSEDAQAHRMDKAHRATITVLSGDPAFTEQTYGVCTLPRMDLRAVRRAIRNSDALILGGGSLLQDATSLRSLLYYLALIRWGLSAHGKVLLVGQGIGPLRRWISRRFVRTTLRKVPFLSVRDAESAQLLRTIGVSHATVDADLTWALTAHPPHVPLDADARWIGLAPRAWRDAPVQEAFTALCRQIRADGYTPLLIPMQESQDRALCEAIATASDARILPSPNHPAQLLGVMQRLQGMVAMRLHGAIFAAAQGTPVLCVSYDPKVDALASQLHAPRIALAQIATELLQVWQAFHTQHAILHEQIKRNTMPLRQRATALIERVNAFIEDSFERRATQTAL